MIYNTPWFTRMQQMLQLYGMSENTQQSYLRALKLLVDHFRRDPTTITEEMLMEYFIYRQNVSKWQKPTQKMSFYGIRFFYKIVLQKEWRFFSIFCVRTDRRLPSVLSRDEVDLIFSKVKQFRHYVFFFTVYSCGLRLMEGLCLEVSDIDAKRMMLHVHRGKGARNRYIPLPEQTLYLLRKYWLMHKNPRLIFPSLGRGGQEQSGYNTESPTRRSTVQQVFKRAFDNTGIKKRSVSIHTLRHSYATHLLEGGVNLPTIQRYMGHSHINTTLMYLHLTKEGNLQAYQIINDMMNQNWNFQN